MAEYKRTDGEEVIWVNVNNLINKLQKWGTFTSNDVMRSDRDHLIRIKGEVERRVGEPKKTIIATRLQTLWDQYKPLNEKGGWSEVSRQYQIGLTVIRALVDSPSTVVQTETKKETGITVPVTKPAAQTTPAEVVQVKKEELPAPKPVPVPAVVESKIEAIKPVGAKPDVVVMPDEKKIFGMPKTVVYIGGAVATLGLGYLAYKKLVK